MTLLIINCAFWLGIFLGSLVEAPFLSIFPLILLAFLFYFFIFRDYNPFWYLAIFIFVALLGFWRYQLALPASTSIRVDQLQGREVEVEGEINSLIRKKKGKLEFVIRPHYIRIADSLRLQPRLNIVEGGILVRLRTKNSLHYKDNLSLRGVIALPQGESALSFRNYLQTKGVYALLLQPQLLKVEANYSLGVTFIETLLKWRGLLLRQIQTHFPEPHASLLAGIVLGVRSELEPMFYQRLRYLGLLHIIVASGFNVSLLIGLVLMLFRFLDKRLQFLLALILVLIYGFIAGFDPPIVRAIVMGLFSFLALTTGNLKHNLLMLLSSATLMLIGNPFLYRSVSFQLSFGATLALFLFYPFLRISCSFIPFVGDIVATTLAVQLFLLPWLLFLFGEFSSLSLFSNIVILPVIEGLMAYGLLWLLFSFILPSFLMAPFTFLLWLPLEYFVRWVNVLGRNSFFWRVSFFPWWAVLLYYFFLGLWWWRFVYQSSKNVA